MADDQRVCLLTGAGPGTGAAIARRFAAGGYRVAMLARKEPRVNELAAGIDGAEPYVCDVAAPEQLAATVAAVRADLGEPTVMIHNATLGAFGDFLKVDPDIFERNFRVNATALLRLAQAVAPAMIERGEGAILCTGNTAAYRGVPYFAGFAPTKAAQRILAESLARSLGPKGIHVAYVASTPSSTCRGRASATRTCRTSSSASRTTLPARCGTSPTSRARRGRSTP